MSNDLVTLEKAASFSKSILWEWHQDFYLQSGVEAWKKAVPHYITSNPFIANSYAEIIIAFISEWVEKNPTAINEPFYLLELGAGHAKFSFYLLKRLLELKPRWPSSLKLCYLITDFSEKNIDFAFSHPNFQAYIQQGLLDFAVFDLEKRNTIYLKKATQELGFFSLKNPLVVCANYILDSIRKDAFYVDEHHCLYESLVSLKTSPDNLKDGIPLDLQKVHIEFERQKLNSLYYKEDEFNKILLTYTQEISKKSFLLPTECFRLIDYLTQITQKPLLLISSDKGYASSNDFPSSGSPYIAFHERCISMMTNFDAIARYFQIRKGDAFMQKARPGLATCAYLSNLKFIDLPKTQTSLEIYLNRFSPQDYFNFYMEMDRAADSATLETLASYLNLSGGDPYLFNRLSRLINTLVVKATPSMKEFLKHLIRWVSTNFYSMPTTENVYFNVGIFFHTVNEFEEATAHYQQSLSYFGDDFNTLYNLGLCYYHLNNFEQAEIYFTRAMAIQADSRAKEWLNKTRKKNGRRVF